MNTGQSNQIDCLLDITKPIAEVAAKGRTPFLLYTFLNLITKHFDDKKVSDSIIEVFTNSDSLCSETILEELCANLQEVVTAAGTVEFNRKTESERKTYFRETIWNNRRYNILYYMPRKSKRKPLYQFIINDNDPERRVTELRYAICDWKKQKENGDIDREYKQIMSSQTYIPSNVTNNNITINTNNNNSKNNNNNNNTNSHNVSTSSTSSTTHHNNPVELTELTAKFKNSIYDNILNTAHIRTSSLNEKIVPSLSRKNKVRRRTKDDADLTDRGNSKRGGLTEDGKYLRSHSSFEFWIAKHIIFNGENEVKPNIVSLLRCKTTDFLYYKKKILKYVGIHSLDELTEAKCRKLCYYLNV